MQCSSKGGFLGGDSAYWDRQKKAGGKRTLDAALGMGRACYLDRKELTTVSRARRKNDKL